MKYRVFAALAAALMLLCAMPFGAAGAVKEIDSARAAEYNGEDIAALLGFLEQPSAAEGKSNGEALIEGYDPADPATFAEHIDYAESDTYSFIWQKDEAGVKRLISVEIRDKTQLAGVIDLTGCTALRSIALWDLPCVTSLSAAGCAALQTLYCRMCGVSFINASGCSSLWMVSADGLRGIDLAGCAVNCESVTAEGEGSVSVQLDGGADTLTALAGPESEFIGWFTYEGFVSNEAQIAAEGGAYIARFGSEVIHVSGDMDGDGQLTFNDISALYITLISGETDFAANGDFNCDGEVNFADVSALCIWLVS